MSSRGFTLIELLVVIAIIGVLSSVVLASLSTARMKARDALRQNDLHALQTALELYYNAHQTYPVGGAGSDQGWWKSNTTGLLYPLVSDGDLSKLPYDPAADTYVGSGCGGAQFYAYWSDGQKYLLGAVSEAQGSAGCTQTGNWSGPNATNYTYQYYIKNY